MIFEKEEKKLIHFFSDATSVETNIPCYSLHEVLSEKMRSLIQRNRGEARDYFDLWFIKNNVENIDWAIVKKGFLEKCAYKNVHFNSVQDFFNPDRLQQVAITWEKRLNHQLPQQVDREMVIQELNDFFTNLFK